MSIQEPTPGEESTTIQHSLDEYSALNALIQDRGAQWSKHARAIKFDVEFKVIEQERQRVAKELHDEILPLLARLIRSVQSNATHSAGTQTSNFAPPTMLPITDESSLLVDELHEAVAAFRDLLGELHAVDLVELGLIEALKNLCKRYSRFTGRSILFIEQTDECCLSEHQQLCLYRAIQATLRMFADCDNDILLIRYDRCESETIITARCVDKRVAASDWLVENHNFDTFESWCRIAGAEVAIDALEYMGDQFPCDLVISASEVQAPEPDAVTLIGEDAQFRLLELDSIMAVAQEEWADALNRDCILFKKLALESERKKISDDINTLIMPRLNSVSKIAQSTKNSVVRKDVKQRMKVIADGVNNVISELHPRLLDEVGFVPSVRTLVDRFRHATLIETTMISNLWSEHLDAIALETRFALYRVIQEALNNIEKHSDATRTLVIVTKNADELVVCVEDNGKGIQRTGVRTMSRGLRIIRERASSIGAQIEISTSSSFDTGTLVTISLPCPGLVLDNQGHLQRVATTSRLA